MELISAVQTSIASCMSRVRDGHTPRRRPDFPALQRGSRFYQVLHPYVIALEAFFLGHQWATGTILSLGQQIVTTTGGATMIDMRHMAILRTFFERKGLTNEATNWLNVVIESHSHFNR